MKFFLLLSVEPVRDNVLAATCISLIFPDPRVCLTMAFGGWSSYDAIKLSLAEPIEENIIGSMSSASL